MSWYYFDKIETDPLRRKIVMIWKKALNEDVKGGSEINCNSMHWNKNLIYRELLARILRLSYLNKSLVNVIYDDRSIRFYNSPGPLGYTNYWMTIIPNINNCHKNSFQIIVSLEKNLLSETFSSNSIVAGEYFVTLQSPMSLNEELQFVVDEKINEVAKIILSSPLIHLVDEHTNRMFRKNIILAETQISLVMPKCLSQLVLSYCQDMVKI